MSRRYPYPPIAEAIIEFRFAGKVSEKAFETATRRLAKVYPRIEDLRQFGVVLGPPLAPSMQPSQLAITRRMTSPDGADIVMLHAERLALSRLAPYLGWDVFIGRFQEAMKLGGALVGRRKLARIGIRFINRLDVPSEEGGGFDHTRYINLGLAPLPFEHGPVAGLAFSLAATLEGGRFGLAINCYKAESPLPRRAALFLDIEVFNQVNVPSDPSEIWMQVAEMRDWKNRVFESSITDASRDLFQ